MKNFRYRLFCFSYTVKQFLKRQFTNSGLAFLGCVVVSAIVGIDTKQTMAYQIFTFLLSILSVAIVSSLRFRYRFNATRICPRFGSVGVKLRYTITIDNRTNKIQKGLKLLEDFADPRPSLAEFSEIIASNSGKSNFFKGAWVYYRWLKFLADKQRAT